MSKKHECPQEEVPAPSFFKHNLKTWLTRERGQGGGGQSVQRSVSLGGRQDEAKPVIVNSTKPQPAVRRLKKAVDEGYNVDLLLIGKTGNGKSATGNSILRQRSFRSLPSATSVTKTVEYEVTEFKGRIIKVMDGPGLMDTCQNLKEHFSFIMESMEYAIAANPRGYHAFLLVVKFGGRFTNEDRETIDILKTIFGESFVKNYCIVAMTCGDQFEQLTKETGQSFEEWCSDQDGTLKELINECDNRVMLFDNNTIDETKRCVQIDKLLHIVDNLRYKGNRYTDENFEKAREARERFQVEAKKQLITEDMLIETSLILTKLQDLELEYDFEVKMEPLEELKPRTVSLVSTVSSQDCGTGVLHDLCETVTSLLTTVDDEIDFCNRLKIEIEKMRKTEEEKLRLLEYQMTIERQDYERRLAKQQLLSGETIKFETEQEKRRRDLEERKKMKPKIMDEKLQWERVQEELKFNKKFAELRERYRKVKTQNDQIIFENVVSVVAWPFRKLKKLFSKE